MEAIETLINLILAGGPQAVAAILILVVFFCIYTIRSLNARIKEKDILLKNREERNEQLMERYHDATLTVVGALNNVEKAIVEIKAKL